MEQYVHLLIPKQPEFVPSAERVGDFVSALAEMGAAPQQCRLALSWPSGRKRTFVDPVKGVARTFPILDVVPVAWEEVAEEIQGLEQYTVSLIGSGPARLEWFELYGEAGSRWKESYAAQVRVQMRPEPVSMSKWESAWPFGGEPGPGRTGVFANPWTGEDVEVADAASAQFWVEFEVGKGLAPRSVGDLNPAIVDAARRVFGVEFGQGCQLL